MKIKQKYIQVFVAILLVSVSCAKPERDELDVNTPSGLLFTLMKSGSYCTKLRTITSPVIDGSPSEYTAEDKIFTDAAGDSTGPAGTDLKDLYIANDGVGNFLFHFVTDNVLPNNYQMNWNFDSNYNLSVFADAAGVHTWKAEYWPNQNCINQTTNIAYDGTGNVEVKIPYSCLQITPPVTIQMNHLNTWRIYQTYGTDFDTFTFTGCIQVEK